MTPNICFTIEPCYFAITFIQEQAALKKKTLQVMSMCFLGKEF